MINKNLGERLLPFDRLLYDSFRISFDAEDNHSKLYEIQYNVTVESFGKEPKIAVTGNQSADSRTVCLISF